MGVLVGVILFLYLFFYIFKDFKTWRVLDFKWGLWRFLLYFFYIFGDLNARKSRFLCGAFLNACFWASVIVISHIGAVLQEKSLYMLSSIYTFAVDSSLTANHLQRLNADYYLRHAAK